MTRAEGLVLAVGVAAIVGVALWRATAPRAQLGEHPFALLDQRGAPFTERDLQGRPSLVFFGYTSCPTVCPTTLARISSWLAALDGDRLRVVFVTVDPERDTRERIAAYLGSFDRRIVGLTGAPDDVEAMLAAWRIHAHKVDEGTGFYTMDHTDALFLLDRDGRLVDTIAHDAPSDEALARLRLLVAGDLAASTSVAGAPRGEPHDRARTAAP